MGLEFRSWSYFPLIQVILIFISRRFRFKDVAMLNYLIEYFILSIKENDCLDRVRNVIWLKLI